MPDTEIVRTCRYGHGSLHVDRGTWTLKHFPTESPPGLPPEIDGANFADVAFVVGLAQCLKCGYIELFDKQPPR
jgi:hypothetical protein